MVAFLWPHQWLVIDVSCLCTTPYPRTEGKDCREEASCCRSPRPPGLSNIQETLLSSWASLGPISNQLSNAAHTPGPISLFSRRAQSAFLCRQLARALIPPPQLSPSMHKLPPQCSAGSSKHVTGTINRLSPPCSLHRAVGHLPLSHFSAKLGKSCKL